MEAKSNNFYRALLVNFIMGIDLGDCAFHDEPEERLNICIYGVLKILKTINNSSDEELLKMHDGIVTTAFLDTFKVLNAKLKENNITYQEKQTYDKLAKVLDFEDLLLALSLDKFLLEELLKYSVEFFSYNELRKITTMKKLSGYQRYNLKTNFELFKNDIDEYDYYNGMPVEILIKYYDEELAKAEKVEGSQDMGAVSANLLDQIIGFITMLAGTDPETFESLMKEIILIDYKWSKYVVGNRLKIDALNIEECIERIDKFESYEIKELIYEEALYDDNYMRELIDSLIFIKCDNLYVDEKVINSEKVENYYQKVVRSKKKLNNYVIIQAMGD